jgi:hypothetical protein
MKRGWTVAASVGVLGFIAGAAAGVLVQKYVGVRSLLGMHRDSTSPAAHATVESSSIGIPDELRGRLSLFVLAGQSNMSGRGELPPEPLHHPRVFMFGNDYRWKPASEPVDSPEGQVDRVSEDSEGDPAGFGPGLSFAMRMVEQRPDVTVGLIPCAKGDTTIAEWERSLADSTLYGSCVKRIRAASLEGALSGLLFFQGEADAIDSARRPGRDLAPAQWAVRFSSIVAAMRMDTGVPSLPVMFAQIGTHTAPQYFPHWATVREQQAIVTLPCAAMISTDDLPLRDAVHFTTESYVVIGARFAAAYLRLAASEECR